MSTREVPGNYRPARPGKIMEKIILSAIRSNLKDIAIIMPSQNGFMKGKSSLPNLISFYDKIICLVDEGKGTGYRFSVLFFPATPASKTASWGAQSVCMPMHVTWGIKKKN